MPTNPRLCTYHIYAIRLSDEVLKKPEFNRRNPHYEAGKPCYYIGSSIYPPRERFEKHMAGNRSSKWVRTFGLHPASKKCFVIETSDPEERYRREREYANELRLRGYGIWQN